MSTRTGKFCTKCSKELYVSDIGDISDPWTICYNSEACELRVELASSKKLFSQQVEHHNNIAKECDAFKTKLESLEAMYSIIGQLVKNAMKSGHVCDLHGEGTSGDCLGCSNRTIPELRARIEELESGYEDKWRKLAMFLQDDHINLEAKQEIARIKKLENVVEVAKIQTKHCIECNGTGQRFYADEPGYAGGQILECSNPLHKALADLSKEKS